MRICLRRFAFIYTILARQCSMPTISHTLKVSTSIIFTSCIFSAPCSPVQLQLYSMVYRPMCLCIADYVLNGVLVIKMSVNYIHTIRYGRLTCAQKLTRWPA